MVCGLVFYTKEKLSLLKITEISHLFHIYFIILFYNQPLYQVWYIKMEGLEVKKLVFNLRKIHRILTVPIVVLMILKFALNDSDYGLIVTKIVSMGMIFMAVTGLFMYIYTYKMKKKNQVISN